MRHWAQTVLEDALWLRESPPDHVREGLERLVALAEQNEFHVFRTAELEQLADDLAEADTLSELSRAMWSLTIATGFQNFVVFLLREAPGVTPKVRVCTSFKDAWITQYQKRGYQYIDPIILEAAARDSAFQFSEIMSSAPLVESFWQDADSHGIGRNGLCFSMTRSSGMRVGVSFCTSKSTEQVQRIVEYNGYDLRYICELVADTFSFIATGPTLSKDTLTIEELRFLRVLASSSDPVEALNTNPKWGSNGNLQSSIRLKLGVQSAFQAVAVAASKGWFNTLPYDQAEVEKPFPTLNGLSSFEIPDSHLKLHVNEQKRLK